MYDIFYVSKIVGNDAAWQNLKQRYPTAQKLENITLFDQIKSRAFTKMYWVIWDDVILNDAFDLTSYQATVWDNNYVHVFKNGQTFDGICLVPKTLSISQREFNHRFYTAKKEVDIQASIPKKYDTFYIDSYEDYQLALAKTTTDMFWVIWPEIEIIDPTIFDFYISHHDVYDRNENHVFTMMLNGEITHNGLMLLSTKKTIIKKEIDFRFLVSKKEHSRLASRLREYDVIFISYNEPNADENFNNLKERFPRAKRIHGVKGIHQAHIEAAKLSKTDMFWVVDGDAVIVDDFNFDHQVTNFERDIVHVWRSQNPINNLVYGYGGVKLLPKKLTLTVDINSPDMTTSISKRFKAMSAVSNLTAFNTDPFNTWKSAFRECVKLSSKTISGQVNNETEERLETWCTSWIRDDIPNVVWAIKGAQAGRLYGSENRGNKEALAKINDFDWLKEQFKHYE
jgi:hypothetical protein